MAGENFLKRFWIYCLGAAPEKVCRTTDVNCNEVYEIHIQNKVVPRKSQRPLAMRLLLCTKGRILWLIF